MRKSTQKVGISADAFPISYPQMKRSNKKEKRDEQLTPSGLKETMNIWT
jgi:hypothetical protein